MSKPTLSRSPPSAIPILMRLPDLRLSKQIRDIAEAAPEQPREEVRSATENVAPPAPMESELPQVGEPEQPMDTVASSAGSVTDIQAPDTHTATASEPTASLPPDTQPEETADPSALANTVAVANEEPTATVPHKLDVTDASPADSAEPFTPATARRQRALGRQRRQVADPPRQRTWWTTHLPVIAVGFLIALVLTIYVGRANRASHSADSQASMELPELEIDTGDGSDSFSPGVSEPQMLAVDPPKEATSDAIEVKPSVKSPPLLSARPKAAVANEPALVENPRTTAKPSNESEITNPYVTAPAESVRAAAELSLEPATDYPSTEPAVYRPGGRAPREARVPNYPQTSTPHLR